LTEVTNVYTDSNGIRSGGGAGRYSATNATRQSIELACRLPL